MKIYKFLTFKVSKFVKIAVNFYCHGNGSIFFPYTLHPQITIHVINHTKIFATNYHHKNGNKKKKKRIEETHKLLQIDKTNEMISFPCVSSLFAKYQSHTSKQNAPFTWMINQSIGFNNRPSYISVCVHKSIVYSDSVRPSTSAKVIYI